MKLENGHQPNLIEFLSGFQQSLETNFAGTASRDVESLDCEHFFTTREALAKLSPASTAPLFCYSDTFIGQGIVGGGCHNCHRLVEDETALRRLRQRVLERHGCHIHAAVSGVQALEIWRERREGIDILSPTWSCPTA